MKRFSNYAELKQALQGLQPEDVLVAVEFTPELVQDILNHDPVNRVLRPGHVQKLTKEITAGHWDPRKSSFIRFTQDGRLNDGQHRCQAVLASGKSIIVHIVVVVDTIGLDQGANRTLSDQLKIHNHLEQKQECDLAAAVTKAICKIPSPTDRELLEVFEGNRDFVLECVRKPLGWLADKEPSVISVMKPNMLAVIRAEEILVYKQPPAEVDELLEDMTNGGHTAPEGSTRKAVARQIWDAMQAAHMRRGAKHKDVVKWVSVGLDYKRKGITKSVTMARFSAKSQRKLSKAIAETQPLLVQA